VYLSINATWNMHTLQSPRAAQQRGPAMSETDHDSARNYAKSGLAHPRRPYFDFWDGGVRNLARAYLDSRAECGRLREALERIRNRIDFATLKEKAEFDILLDGQEVTWGARRREPNDDRQQES